MSKLKKFAGIAFAGAIGLSTISIPHVSAEEKSITNYNQEKVAFNETFHLSMENQQNTSLKLAASANLNVNVDVLGIADRIRDAVNANANRSGFVKNVMESTFYSAGQRYNVMVFNLNQGYVEQFRGVKFYGSTNYNGTIYGIWVFEDGEFTNEGDGGWINWAFKGWFDRNDKHVKFYRP
ncbi:hypothetical protein V7024_16350 [Bacillus sp. JJ864]|uniref:hypothetical protein n=1 Tax=Bacillus sp. JJ864 TaxID=3122975 RepID=UPI0030001D3B